PGAPGRGHSAARPGRHGAAGPRVVARPLLAVARRGRTRRTAAVAGAVSASRQLAAGAGLAIAPGACYREGVTSPESCTRFTSEKYITISDTHTTPYSSMKQRSEERRVGKECRSRGSPNQEKQKRKRVGCISGL